MGYETVDLRDETEQLLVREEVRQHPAWVRLNDQLGWYEAKSAANQKRYKQIQAAQIILATSIPVFSLIDAASGETSPWSRYTHLYPHRGKLTSSTVPAVALLQFPGLVIWRQHVSPPLRSFAFQGHAVLSMFLKATGRLPRPLSARRSGVSALRCCLPRRSGRLGPAAVPAAQ
jgi:hypothetical protein